MWLYCPDLVKTINPALSYLTGSEIIWSALPWSYLCPTLSHISTNPCQCYLQNNSELPGTKLTLKEPTCCPLVPVTTVTFALLSYDLASGALHWQPRWLPTTGHESSAVGLAPSSWASVLMGEWRQVIPPLVGWQTTCQGNMEKANESQ